MSSNVVPPLPVIQKLEFLTSLGTRHSFRVASRSQYSNLSHSKPSMRDANFLIVSYCEFYLGTIAARTNLDGIE